MTEGPKELTLDEKKAEKKVVQSDLLKVLTKVERLVEQSGYNWVGRWVVMKGLRTVFHSVDWRERK